MKFHLSPKKVMEFKASDLFAEYTAALHSGKVSNKVKQPWFRKHWKSDDDLDEQIKLWKNKIEKALTMPTMPVLPAPVGPAQKQDDDEPPVKVVKLDVVGLYVIELDVVGVEVVGLNVIRVSVGLIKGNFVGV